jgi:hypothetical protein
LPIWFSSRVAGFPLRCKCSSSSLQRWQRNARAVGMTLAAWFSWPMVVAISSYKTFFRSKRRLMSAVHDSSLAIGRDRSRSRVLIFQPRIIFVSSGVPSASVLSKASSRSSQVVGLCCNTGFPNRCRIRRLACEPDQIASSVSRKQEMSEVI